MFGGVLQWAASRRSNVDPGEIEYGAQFPGHGPEEERHGNKIKNVQEKTSHMG
jgi:hypothetical protein